MKLKSYQLSTRVIRLGIVAALVLLSIAQSPRLGAQGLDSKGKEFWVAFMANFGSGGPGEISDLRVYLSCTKPTRVTLTYTATGQSIVVPLPVANTEVEVQVNTVFGDFVELDDVNSLSGEVTPKSIHVVADDEVSLYGANIRSKSADAFLGLPIDVLTGHYIVLAYPNGYSGNFFNGQGSYDMPSEFCVIATEDSTNLVITPPPGITLNGRPAAPFNVTLLNRGEVFFGQADIYPDHEQDVSGVQVVADKPVAVFGGNKRTSIPTRVGNYRDHLCEQLPPLDAWGNGALLTPHYRVTPSSTDTAVARIIAAFPGTDVKVTDASGTTSYTIGPGISVEVPLLGPMSVAATQPIMVAQYEHSVNVMGLGADIGDPFMMLVPPPEQFDTAYSFQSIIHSEFVNPHYINVVIPPQGVGSLKLDGAAVNNTFNPIPGSRYVYAQIKVFAGSHHISSDSAFGLLVYGFGSATSYGYPGGMLFRKLVRDFEPPEMRADSGCNELKGIAFDSRITDTGVDSCYATSDTQNVKVTIDPFKSGADTVGFRGSLIDPYRDGVLGIRTVDREGRSRTLTRSIPGFTVECNGYSVAPALLDTFVAINAQSFCRKIWFKNYGRFPQIINGVTVSDSSNRSIDPAQFPLIIQPGDTAGITICFSNFPDSIFSTEMTLLSSCSMRLAAIIPVDNRIDTSAPSVGIEGSPCGDDFILTYFERARGAGIASVDVDTTINCTSENLIDPQRLPAQLVQVKLHRIDARQDMIYKVTLRDAVGNSLVDVDTIGGFTLNAFSETGDTVGSRYDRPWLADSITLDGQHCQPIIIRNYGLKPLHIQHAVMRGNVLFSIPPAQLPLTIAPGDSALLEICIDGKSDQDLADTLDILDGCNHAEEIMVMAPLKLLTGNGTTSCGTAISVATVAPTKRAFLTTPLPNPVAGAATVDVGLPHATAVTVRIYAATGQPVMNVLNGDQLPAGISRVTFDVSALDPGAYFCRMTTAEGAVHVEKIIVRR
ncbi:MAG TPA: T9SS type A sorting domain-containing protein [Candidatus Kapabacteria bacterium]|nr:T9SS type A sorting domain-containing protein [Candidatus Kapabacteria bacterium]